VGAYSASSGVYAIKESIAKFLEREYHNSPFFLLKSDPPPPRNSD
jgi:hypothetical protein